MKNKTVHFPFSISFSTSFFSFFPLFFSFFLLFSRVLYSPCLLIRECQTSSNSGCYLLFSLPLLCLFLEMTQKHFVKPSRVFVHWPMLGCLPHVVGVITTVLPSLFHPQVYLTNALSPVWLLIKIPIFSPCLFFVLFTPSFILPFFFFFSGVSKAGIWLI